MEVRNLPVSSLKPAKYNPRKDLQPGDPEWDKLARSITEFGLVEPLVWNELTGNLVGGHQRLKVLKSQGVETVPVAVVSLDASQEKALNVALNKIAGDWEPTPLADLLSGLSNEGLLELTGFDEAELDALIDELSPRNLDDLIDPEGEVDESQPAITQLGDVWQLGEHRVICGDCTDANVAASLFGAERAQMVWTDPPYGVAYQQRGNPRWGSHEPIANDDLQGTDLTEFWTAAFEVALQYATGDCYVAAPSGPPCVPMHHAIEAAGWEQHQWLIWVKQQLVLGRSNYHYRHEHIWYGWPKGATSSWAAGRDQNSVFEVDRPHKSDDHPTMKPIELVAQMVSNSSKPRDIVYDCFLGSGTTLLACEQLGRKCYGIELSPHYCDLIVRRWETLTGRKAEREGDGQTDQADA